MLVLTWRIKDGGRLTWDISICKGAGDHGSSGEAVILAHRTKLPTCSEIIVNLKGTCFKSGGLFSDAGTASSSGTLSKSPYLSELVFIFHLFQKHLE